MPVTIPNLEETTDYIEFKFPNMDNCKIVVVRKGSNIEFKRGKSVIYRYTESASDGFFLDDQNYEVDETSVKLYKVHFLVENS